MPRPWLLLVWTSLAAWASSTGCHEFHTCYDRQCEPPQMQAGSTGKLPATEGGSAGQAAASPGAAGPLSEEAGESPTGNGGRAGEAGASPEEGVTPECAAPLADCDESALSVCESNLLTDLANCGACRARCDGICAQGECHPFEALAFSMTLPTTGGIAHTPKDVFALSSSEFFPQLVRWAPKSGLQVLLNGGESFAAVVEGADRLFLIGSTDNELSSVPFTGGPPASEKAFAKTAVVFRDDLYAIDLDGVPYRRALGSGKRTDIPLPTPAVSGFSAILATDGDGVALLLGGVGQDASPGSYSAYRLRSEPGVSWQLAATGMGSPHQLLVAGDTLYVDVKLAAGDYFDNDETIEHRLLQLRPDGDTRTIASTPGIVDFELVSDRIYVSRRLPDRTASLRIVPLADPSLTTEYQAASGMTSLTYLEPYFYFGTTFRDTLSRVRGWLP